MSFVLAKDSLINARYRVWFILAEAEIVIGPHTRYCFEVRMHSFSLKFLSFLLDTNLIR